MCAAQPLATYFGMAYGDHKWRVGHETVGIYNRKCSCRNVYAWSRQLRHSVTLGTPADTESVDFSLGSRGPNKSKYKLDGQPDDGILSALPSPCRTIQLIRPTVPAISPSCSICRCGACHFLKMPRSNARRHMNTAHPRVTSTKFPLTLRSPTRPLTPPCNFFLSN